MMLLLPQPTMTWNKLKEKIDFLSVMLLAFLGVEEDMIIEDYLSINPYLNLAPHAQIVKKLDPDSQEAMTLLLTANRATAEYIQIGRAHV